MIEITIDDCLEKENIDLLLRILDKQFHYDLCLELEYCYDQANELFEQAVSAESKEEEIWCKRSARCFRSAASRIYQEIRETSPVYQFTQFIKRIFI